MFTTLIHSLILAAGGLLSVGSVTIVILLLSSDQGWHCGLAYVLGYVGAYALIGVSVVWVGYTLAATGSESTGSFTAILLVVLGLLLLWLAWRNWRRPPAATQAQPRLFAVIDRITPTRAFGLGALVTILNFKNLAIFLSAVSVIVVSDLPLRQRVIVVLLVVLVFCAAVIAPVLIYVIFPRQADRRLNWIRETIETHRRSIGIWAPLVFGLIFLIRGVTGLL